MKEAQEWRQAQPSDWAWLVSEKLWTAQSMIQCWRPWIRRHSPHSSVFRKNSQMSIKTGRKVSMFANTSNSANKKVLGNIWIPRKAWLFLARWWEIPGLYFVHCTSSKKKIPKQNPDLPVCTESCCKIWECVEPSAGHSRRESLLGRDYSWIRRGQLPSKGPWASLCMRKLVILDVLYFTAS